MFVDEWNKVSLDDLLSLEYGESLPATRRSGDGFPVYGSSGEVGRHEHPLVEGPGIVVGRKGTVGAVNWTEEPFWPIDTTYYVVSKGQADLRWCFWLLSSLPLKKLDSSTGVPGLNRNDAYLMLVDVPPLPEQRRIAEILDTADRAIGETEALISKLKRMKTGLMHDLLTRGLDEHGQLRDSDAHPEQFKDSLLGRIPREWAECNLESTSTKIQDGTHFSPQSKEGPFRYITSRNIRFGYLDLTGSGWITAEEHKQIYARCDVRHGDVLLTKDGANTGNAAINTLSKPFSLLSSVALIRPREQHLSAQFLLQYILSPATQRRLTDIVSGLAITRLTLEKIKALAIVVPSLQEQRRITEILDAHDTRIRAEEAYRDKLKLQKKGLMEDLLTGRVRVKTAQEVGA